MCHLVAKKPARIGSSIGVAPHVSSSLFRLPNALRRLVFSAAFSGDKQPLHVQCRHYDRGICAAEPKCNVFSTAFDVTHFVFWRSPTLEFAVCRFRCLKSDRFCRRFSHPPVRADPRHSRVLHSLCLPQPAPLHSRPRPIWTLASCSFWLIRSLSTACKRDTPASHHNRPNRSCPTLRWCCTSTIWWPLPALRRTSLTPMYCRICKRFWPPTLAQTRPSLRPPLPFLPLTRIRGQVTL
jgi:hypothetical protein